MNFKDKTVCVIDTGLGMSYVGMALREHYGRVLVWGPWVDTYPKSVTKSIGTEIPGIERIDFLFDHLDEIDLFVFLYSNMGDIQKHLRKLGKRVFGAGKGEDFELFRHSAKDYQKQVGLPTPQYQLIIGIEKLAEYLKTHNDCYVKLSQTRGDDETWHHTSYVHAITTISHFSWELGPLAVDYEFIVEQPVKNAQEYGGDQINVDGLWLPTACFGYEVKDKVYCGTHMPYEKLPAGVRTVDAKLEELFRQYGYRGFYSSEIRDNGKPHLIDSTCRMPLPPGETYWSWIRNMPQVIWDVAGGIATDIKPAKKYVFEYLLYSEETGHDWLAVTYPEKIEKYVCLYNHVRKRGVNWIAPTISKLRGFGAVIGMGDTIAEAEAQAKERVEQVESDGLEIKTEAVGELYDTLRKAEKAGIYFGESPIPD